MQSMRDLCVCLLINSFWLIKLHYTDIKCYCLAMGKTRCVREMSMQVGHTRTHMHTHTLIMSMLKGTHRHDFGRKSQKKNQQQFGSPSVVHISLR